ncbi:MAG: hypothetical protein ACSLFD_00460 [Solirubrobacterales bacterium]
MTKGDEACLNASDDLDQVTKEYSAAIESGDLEAAGEQLDSMIEISKTRNDELASIEVDGDGQAALDEYVEVNDESITYMEDMASALADEDIEGITAATQEIATLNVEGVKAAKEFGFESCGSGVVG